MVNFTSVYSILNGFGYARALAAQKADDDAARQGCNLFLAGFAQFGQIYAFFQHLNLLEKVSSHPYLSGKARIGIYLSAPLITILTGSIKKNRTEQKVAETSYWAKTIFWLYGNVGSLCQIAAVVTDLALFYLGCRAYAVASLSVLALGYLERKNYLPLKIREVYLRVTPWIGNISLLTTGNRFFQALGTIELFGKVQSLFGKSDIPYDKVPFSSRLSFAQFNQILAGKATLTIDKEHIHISPFPTVRTFHFDALLKLCDSCNWGKASLFSQLENKLARDARWVDSKEYQQTLKTSVPEEIKALKIKYVQNQFATLVKSIEFECISTGVPLHYGVLKNYLGYIAENLPRAEEDQQVQIMLQLAVEGGDYCGPGVYYQLESAAAALFLRSSLSQTAIDERPRLPLRQRILFLLQQERLKVVYAFHLLIGRVNKAVHVLAGGEEDVHAMNQTINLFASDFGLPDQGAKHDMTVVRGVVEKYYYRYVLGIQPEHLWSRGFFANKIYEGYTKERILDTIKDQIGVALIPQTDVFSWALEWIKKPSINEKEREDFLTKLQDGYTFQSSQLKFHNAFIQAMLVDMGILTIKP